MVERDDEIKLESGTKKLRENLSEEEDSEEEALEEFNSTLDNVLETLSQEKDGTKVDWQDDPLHETEDFFVGLDKSIQLVVVQNNVQQEVAREVVLYPPVHEDVVEEMAANQSTNNNSIRSILDKEKLNGRNVTPRQGKNAMRKQEWISSQHMVSIQRILK
ncbi:hypothetical protein Tco_1289171 [Tanacetum coccineum]